MSDDVTEAAPPDSATAMCYWLIALTSLGLLIAFFIVESILKEQYGMGMLA